MAKPLLLFENIFIMNLFSTLISYIFHCKDNFLREENVQEILFEELIVEDEAEDDSKVKHFLETDEKNWRRRNQVSDQLTFILLTYLHLIFIIKK